MVDWCRLEEGRDRTICVDGDDIELAGPLLVTLLKDRLSFFCDRSLVSEDPAAATRCKYILSENLIGFVCVQVGGRTSVVFRGVPGSGAGQKQHLVHFPYRLRALL
jgi:hypothetical protein